MYDAAVCHLDAKVGGSLVVQSPSAAASSKSKRGLDLLVSALMLIALLPVLLLIAILIRIESRNVGADSLGSPSPSISSAPCA